MNALLKKTLLVFLLGVGLGVSALGCDPYYHHHYYRDGYGYSYPSYGSGYYGDEWRYRHHHDD